MYGGTKMKYVGVRASVLLARSAPRRNVADGTHGAFKKSSGAKPYRSRRITEKQHVESKNETSHGNDTDAPKNDGDIYYLTKRNAFQNAGG